MNQKEINKSISKKRLFDFHVTAPPLGHLPSVSQRHWQNHILYEISFYAYLWKLFINFKFFKRDTMSENALKRIKSAAPAKFQGLPPRAPIFSSQMKVTGCNLAKLRIVKHNSVAPVKPPQLVISRRFTPPESRSCTTTPKLTTLHHRRLSKEKTPHSVRVSYDRRK